MSKPVVTEYEVFSERIRKPLKIALVTDLHERRAIDILNLLRAQNPDLTVVAGDTLERYRERYQSTVMRTGSFSGTTGFTAWTTRKPRLWSTVTLC